MVSIENSLQSRTKHETGYVDRFIWLDNIDSTFTCSLDNTGLLSETNYIENSLVTT